tara:strand:- start:527 stop:838 length:312 start_codon:yes stop_codon:yes gene_type:complete
MKTLSEGVLEFVMKPKTYDGVVSRLGNSVQTKAKGHIKFDIYINGDGNYIFTTTTPDLQKWAIISAGEQVKIHIEEKLKLYILLPKGGGKGNRKIFITTKFTT